MDLYRKYLEMVPLLYTFFPEAEFTAITSPDELNHRLYPFIPAHACQITRIRDTIFQVGPQKTFSIGFGKMKEKQFDSEANILSFPWSPSFN